VHIIYLRRAVLSTRIATWSDTWPHKPKTYSRPDAAGLLMSQSKSLNECVVKSNATVICWKLVYFACAVAKKEARDLKIYWRTADRSATTTCGHRIRCSCWCVRQNIRNPQVSFQFCWFVCLSTRLRKTCGPICMKLGWVGGWVRREPRT